MVVRRVRERGWTSRQAGGRAVRGAPGRAAVQEAGWASWQAASHLGSPATQVRAPGLGGISKQGLAANSWGELLGGRARQRGARESAWRGWAAVLDDCQARLCRRDPGGTRCAAVRPVNWR